MEELIRKIIKVDKEARKRTEESQRQLAASKIKIAERKKELEEKYSASVEEIIELTTEEEKEKAETLMAQTDEKFARADAKLEETFAAGREKWVEELYRRVIEK